MHFRNRIVVAVFALFWLAALGYGTRVLLRYEQTAGAAGTPPAHWPAESFIHPAPGQVTLVMAVHPQCPCTRASIGELAQIMAKAQGKTTAYLLFLKPRGYPEGWEKTASWRSAAAIPGVTAMTDVDGEEARRFHLVTSGHTILFDAAGHLVFSGGITSSRGHAGDNLGESSVDSILSTGVATSARTQVFGCSLVNAPHAG